MKKSLRSIANMLMGVGALGLFVSTVSTLSFNCGLGTDSCLAGLAWSFESAPYVTDFGLAQTTATEISSNGGWVEFLNLVSVYLLFVAVAILIVLELFELHYLRALVRSRKKFSLR